MNSILNFILSTTNFIKVYHKHILWILVPFVSYGIYCILFSIIDHYGYVVDDNSLELARQRRARICEKDGIPFNPEDITEDDIRKKKKWWWPFKKPIPIYGAITVLIIYLKVGDFARYNTWGWTFTPLGHLVILIYLNWFFVSCFNEAGLL